LSTKVDGLSREVNSVNKRLDDVEESSKFVGAKFDQINKETVTVKSDMNHQL
jgi:tetrahydromethanopterin S-methyltransferase subunit G